jgi:hypothetical protein
MSDDERVVGSSIKRESEISPEEKERRIAAAVQRLAGLSPGEWRLYYEEEAQRLDISADEYRAKIEAAAAKAKIEAEEAKATNAQVQRHKGQRGKRRAEKKRLAAEEKQRRADGHAESEGEEPQGEEPQGEEPEGEPLDDHLIEETRLKYREKQEACETLAKFSGARREAGLAELAERLGEDLITSRKEFADFGGGEIFLLKEKDPDILLRLAGEASLFCDRADVAYADIVVAGHRVTWPLASTEFADWLRHRFYIETQKGPSDSAIKTALQTLRAHAKFGGGEQHEVHLRVAEFGGKIYVDLGDPEWRVVEIDAYGWRLVDRAPVRFRRTSTMGALPAPKRGGSMELLRKYVNLNEPHFVLYVSAILNAFRVRGPHVILLFVGPPGATKSTKVRIACHLTDPDTLDIVVDPPGLPRSERDLVARAHNARVISSDNVGTNAVTASMSDALCLVSSGQNSNRKLFTDKDVAQVGGSHPAFMTAVSNPIKRPDLAERTATIPVPAFDEVKQERRERIDLSDRFEAERPLILGAIFSAVSHGLRRLPEVKLKLPRMADFAKFATACETAFASAGDFMAAYSESVTELAEHVSEDKPIVIAIRAFMANRSDWTGTVTKLMSELEQHDRAEEKPSTWRSWPTDSGQFGKQLREVVGLLAKFGIAVTFEKDTSSDRTRIIKLRRVKPD